MEQSVLDPDMQSASLGGRLCEFGVESWTGPFSRELREVATEVLEGGKVLVFPRLPFALEPKEHRLLSSSFSNGKSKNISLKLNGELSGTIATGEDAVLLRDMMRRFAHTATAFIEALVPGYAGCLERAPTSYRPVEIEGRPASVIHDDTRLHVDAFPSRPMQGRRIMRLFANINPHGAPRVWHVGEPFEIMARNFDNRVREGSRVHAALLSAFGVTKGRRSAYDSIMLGLHDSAKLDDRYQKTSPQREVRFAPGTSWLCYTDQVMHAALAGQFVLEQTFHLAVDAMANPELSPLRVLERLRGHALL